LNKGNFDFAYLVAGVNDTISQNIQEYFSFYVTTISYRILIDPEEIKKNGNQNFKADNKVIPA